MSINLLAFLLNLIQIFYTTLPNQYLYVIFRMLLSWEFIKDSLSNHFTLMDHVKIGSIVPGCIVILLIL